MTPRRTYESVSQIFNQYNCKLLCNKNEFNEIYLNAESKLNINASCGHEHSISYHRFTRNKDNIICPNCNYSNISKKLKTLASGTKHYLESDAINYLKTLVCELFDVQRTYEGCKADIGIKPKNVSTNRWLGVQIKSTFSKTNKKNNIGYKFNLGKDYKDMIIICIAIQDKQIWIFENNDLIHLKSGLTIRNESKYNNFKIDNSLELNKILFNKYETLEKFNFEDLDVPQSNAVKIEYEYRKIREKAIDFLDFIKNENEGEVYDFKIGNKKIQEKVAGIRNYDREEYMFNLHKMSGIKCKKKADKIIWLEIMIFIG
jgi:hypothetical protein